VERVRRWLEAGTPRRFACAIKSQGATDFAAIPGICATTSAS
jgi:hypothetical protein